jgi:class 3 adenylate cyclase
VLLSDLSGYTTLNQVLDPEEVARVMNRLKAEATPSAACTSWASWRTSSASSR